MPAVPDGLEQPRTTPSGSVEGPKLTGTSAPRVRAEILRRACERFGERADDVARLISLEKRKALHDARSEAAYLAACYKARLRLGRFRSTQLQQALIHRRMFGSMGQVGSAGDNAAMETAFSLAAEERPQPPGLDTRYQLRIAIVTWI
jgi:transposase InsO family protein